MPMILYRKEYQYGEGRSKMTPFKSRDGKVVELAEWLLLTTDDHGSNPVVAI